MAVRTARAIQKNSEIFIEFNQSKILLVLVLLYPLGPLLLLFGGAILPTVILFLLATACYVPGFIVAHRQQRAFECVGTSRVEKARKSISLATGGAILGFIYISLIIAYSSGIKAYMEGI